MLPFVMNKDVSINTVRQSWRWSAFKTCVRINALSVQLT